MNRLRRINPRRPFVTTGLGRKRYTLGQAADAYANALTASGPAAAVATDTPKPRRLSGTADSCIMAVAHSQRGVLSLDAQQAVAAAALLAHDRCAVLLVVFGALHEEAGALGADRLIVIPNAGAYQPDTEIRILGHLIERYAPAHIIMADNELPDGDLGRRLAVQNNYPVATHVVELSAAAVSVYQQQGAVYGRQALPRLILLDPDCVDARLPFSGQGEKIAWEAPDIAGDPAEACTSPYRDVGITTVPASRLSLEEADFIISAGNGMRDMGGFHALAEVLAAAVGASRVAVDDGRFKREQQIGATGKTVSSSVYIALGISGAVQHLQGIKDCRHVIAVNTDVSAPMIKRADLSIIDDAQALARALFDEVSTAQAQAAKHPS